MFEHIYKWHVCPGSHTNDENITCAVVSRGIGYHSLHSWKREELEVRRLLQLACMEERAWVITA